MQGPLHFDVNCLLHFAETYAVSVVLSWFEKKKNKKKKTKRKKETVTN